MAIFEGGMGISYVFLFIGFGSKIYAKFHGLFQFLQKKTGFLM